MKCDCISTAIRPSLDLVKAAICAATVIGFSGLLANAMTVTPTFNSSITGSSDAAAIEGDINSALTFYDQNFTNPITVKIAFSVTPTNSSASYLGHSISTLYTPDYATYTAAMLANATKYSNSIEQTAYANLQYGNDSSGSNSLLVTSANMRAITGNSAYAGGVNASGQVVSAGTTTGTYDGVITLNAADISGFGGSGTTSPGRVIQHEVDEVLGIGGSGSTLGSSQQATTTGGNYGVTDLFRYSVNHTPSYTTSSNATSYFSINGGQTTYCQFQPKPGRPTDGRRLWRLEQRRQYRKLCATGIYLCF